MGDDAMSVGGETGGEALSHPVPGRGDYLAGLGQRVREARAIRGMSRKVLSRVSGISERYLAQLEAGQGNVSILLLRRVAAAIGAPLDDLLAEPGSRPAEWPVIRDLLRAAGPDRIAAARAALAGPAPGRRGPAPHDRVALVGLRGAGKSTLGRVVAERLGWPFFELNREIERANALSVSEIFALYGQDGYRRFEQAALRALVARPGPMVVATGGGIVASPLTFDLLLSSFFTVWLRARPEDHMARVRAQGDLRPMADDRAAMGELRAILKSREPLYGRAAASLDTSGLPAGAAAEALAALIGPGSRPAGRPARRPGGGRRLTFGDLLRERGLWEPGTRAVRVTLHPADRSVDVPSLASLVGQGLLPVYVRMQEGRRLGHGGLLAEFAAETAGRARLAGFRRVFARRPGIVPGDIVYDYDAAALFHAFMTRARRPVFYDALEMPGLDDVVGRLTVAWPPPLASAVRAADAPGLTLLG